MKKINIFAMFMLVSGVSFGFEMIVDRYQRPCTPDKRHDVLLQEKLNYSAQAFENRIIDNGMLDCLEQCCGLENPYIEFVEYQDNIFWAKQIWSEYVINTQCSKENFKDMCELIEYQQYSALKEIMQKLQAVWYKNLVKKQEHITNLNVA